MLRETAVDAIRNAARQRGPEQVMVTLILLSLSRPEQKSILDVLEQILPPEQHGPSALKSYAELIRSQISLLEPSDE